MDMPSTSKGILHSGCFAIVRNIPEKLHSSDLRKFFSFYVENEKFDCFHFRHRPEKILNVPDTRIYRKQCCCVVRFASTTIRSQFIKDYSGQQWQIENSLPLPYKCLIEAVKISQVEQSGSTDAFTEKDLKELIELRPPSLMPQGNVGTPTSYFFDQIRLCKMPPTIIKKLGLKTMKSTRRFGAVPFEYVSKGLPDEDELEKEEDKYKETEPVVDETAMDPLEDIEESYRQKIGPDNDTGADDDDDQCEEWERHEANYNDVTEQDRTKERNYEPELELVWEKGGPGLVWHTDKNYWAEREQGDDCDWKWADDWDVDYSVYYEGKSAGTIDGRQTIEIREDQERWAGKLNDTAFRSKGDKRGTARKRSNSDSEMPNFHSDYGSKLMSKMGWKFGQGLGAKNQGKLEPAAIQVMEVSNIGSEKKGVGYRGEALQRTGFKKRKEYHAIASMYDREKEDMNKPHHRLVLPAEPTSEILHRSNEPTTMKYRSRLLYHDNDS